MTPIEGYFAAPPGPGPFPGVVVIHEIFGINENIREIARRLAGEGYAALAVDLFSMGNRAVCMLRIIHGMLIRPVRNGIVGDLQDTMGYLGGRADVDPGRIGAVGFCMGGTFALQLAVTGAGLRAASVFYGMNPRPLDVVAQACPVVGSYPAQDPLTAKAARALVPVLERHEVPHDVKVYEGARHSFFNDRGPAFHPEAAKDAWARMLTFFETHLA